jgi:hypothetical protein
MNKKVVSIVVGLFLMTGCTVGFVGDREGGHLVVVPALPVTVELDADQYYYQNGYYYNYQGDVWFYAESRQGPWVRLPRNRYPRNVHYKSYDERGHDQHNQDNREQGGRGHDNR